MTHLPILIQDLALILMAAAVVTLLFKKLNQPVVLGYLIAGFLVGPNFKFFPSVSDTHSITIWAEIGVIFMLFGLGLEFSFNKLTQVGKSASITAFFEIFAMLGAGYLTGQLLNWSKMDSLFLGGILSISSTTIIVRVFDELGLKGKSFVSLVFGVLIVEDLAAILLLVLLSSVALTQTFSGVELIFSSLRLGFFLVLWFLLGIYLLPTILKKFRSLLTDETMLIFAIGLCLMMVIIAAKVGFSPALGAFVMGSLLAETPKGHRISYLLEPVKNLFSAVFFVSVGMLINTTVLLDYFWIILLIAAVTTAGKFLSITVGAIVSGRSLKTSVQAGLSVAQIGEFSFIIATLGKSLKVTSDFLYPIAVTVSALTTFTTPYLIKYSEPFAIWIERRLPEGVKNLLTRYEIAMSSNSEVGVLSLLWSEYGIKIVLNTVAVIAITLLSSQLILPRLGGNSNIESLVNLIACALTLLISAPFLWAIFVGKPKHATQYNVETTERLRRLQFGVWAMKFLIGTTLVGFLVSQFTSVLAFTGVLFVLISALGIFFFSRFSGPLYHKIEKRFISNLTENERLAIEKREKKSELAPWDALLAEFTLSASSPLSAKTLQESGIKEKYGATIVMIERADHRVLAPMRNDLLLPNDKIFLIGNENQLAAAREVIEKRPTEELPPISDNFGLTSLLLTEHDKFINKPIRECGIREAINGLIIGIERNGERILSPDSSMSLLSGDLLWLVGDKTLIKKLRSL